MRIATLSGSLQERSSNAALIRAAREVAPEGVELVVFRSLGDLPWLDPSLEPEPVRELRELIGGADGVLIGRAFLYGLGAMGEAGVERVLDIIRAELAGTMALCGITDLAQAAEAEVRGAHGRERVRGEAVLGGGQHVGVEGELRLPGLQEAGALAGVAGGGEEGGVQQPEL